MSARLCAKCQIVLDSWSNLSNDRRQLHHKINAIESSAKEGCQLCELFLAGFSDDELLMLRAEEKGGCEMEVGLASQPPKDNGYVLVGIIIKKVGQFVIARSYLNVTLAMVPSELPFFSPNLLM